MTREASLFSCMARGRPERLAQGILRYALLSDGGVRECFASKLQFIDSVFSDNKDILEFLRSKVLDEVYARLTGKAG